MKTHVTVHQISERDAFLNVVSEATLDGRGVGVLGYALPERYDRGPAYLLRSATSGHFMLAVFVSVEDFDAWHAKHREAWPVAERILPQTAEVSNG